MAMGGGSRRRTIEPRFIFAALATLVLVPFVIADFTGGDGDNSEVATEADTDTDAVAADDSAETAGDEAAAEASDGEPVSFELDPEWLGRGMSRYGESDEATAARIERWSKLSAGESVEDLPAIDDVTPPPAKDTSASETDTSGSGETEPTPSTSPPVATSPPATAAPSTSPPQTSPPTTVAPTTSAPPATTTTKVAPTTTVVAPAADG